MARSPNARKVAACRGPRTIWPSRDESLTSRACARQTLLARLGCDRMTSKPAWNAYPPTTPHPRSVTTALASLRPRICPGASCPTPTIPTPPPTQTYPPTRPGRTRTAPGRGRPITSHQSRTAQRIEALPVAAKRKDATPKATTVTTASPQPCTVKKPN